MPHEGGSCTSDNDERASVGHFEERPIGQSCPLRYVHIAVAAARAHSPADATLAQSVGQLIRNHQQVVGSKPTGGFNEIKQGLVARQQFREAC
jgi:hypothetical protein